jgi:hypothetical protein
MRSILQSIKKHPFTLLFYILYLLLISHGAVTGYKDEMGGVLILLVAFFFILAMCVNAIARSNDQVWFYLCMIVLIVAPLIVMVKLLMR